MDVKNRRLHLTNITRYEFTPTKTSYLLTNSTLSFSPWACAIVWQARLGNNAFFSIKEFVIGLQLCPMLNHRSIDVLSYVCPSSATTGSRRSSWVMGQTSSREGDIDSTYLSYSSSLVNFGQSNGCISWCFRLFVLESFSNDLFGGMLIIVDIVGIYSR